MVASLKLEKVSNFNENPPRRPRSRASVLLRVRALCITPCARGIELTYITTRVTGGSRSKRGTPPGLTSLTMQTILKQKTNVTRDAPVNERDAHHR